MSCTSKPHPNQFFSPGWDGDTHQPVVDGKYLDPKTGELRKAGNSSYLGPPAVDFIVQSIHEDSPIDCFFRAQRPVPIESMLCQVANAVCKRKLTIDSLNATQYSIRIILAHPLSKDEFMEVAFEMANGVSNSG